MDFKCLSPEEVIKLSASISLILTEKYESEELNIIKNLLCAITNNLSSFLTQEFYFNKNKDKKSN